jgi:hypothetical protein
MNSRIRSWAVRPALLPCLACLLLAAGGCADDKKTQTPAASASAEQAPRPVLDGKLAAAVKAAESARPSTQGGDGPPENGVFAAGLADKTQPPGAPPKVEVLGDGKEPRFLLTPAPADEQREAVSVIVRIQGGAIPVDYALALKVDKPKDDKKDDKPEGPRAVHVVARVAGVTPPAQMPRDLSDKFAKLKGTEVRYTLGTDGAISELAYTLSKDMDPALGETALRALLDAISGAMAPLPKKPLGVGGYWIATDRAPTLLGVDVVRYRVFTVEKIDKDSATLSITVRQYAAKDEATLGALANVAKLEILRFESSGKGKMDWTAGALLPAHAESSVRTAIQGAVGGDQQAQQPQQPQVLQAEVNAKFSAEAPDKKK